VKATSWRRPDEWRSSFQRHILRQRRPVDEALARPRHIPLTPHVRRRTIPMRRGRRALEPVKSLWISAMTLYSAVVWPIFFTWRAGAVPGTTATTVCPGRFTRHAPAPLHRATIARCGWIGLFVYLGRYWPIDHKHTNACRQPRICVANWLLLKGNLSGHRQLRTIARAWPHRAFASSSVAHGRGSIVLQSLSADQEPPAGLIEYSKAHRLNSNPFLTVF